MSYALGIDLGTTYTAAATVTNGAVEIFELGDRSASIPSVVVLKEDGTLLVGEAATRRAALEPGRAASEFKRRLGDPVPVLLGGTPFSVETLSARVLQAVVASVAARQGGPPGSVAVTHPASYSAYRLELLAEACRQAGLADARLCPEPAAAAVYYSTHERVSPGEKIAVYDLGGGTFDIAVLEKGDEEFRLIGRPDGIDRLGGSDFDQAILAHVAASLEINISRLGDSEAGRSGLWRLREDCREAKEALSADTEAVIPVSLPGVQTQVRITRAEFEAMIRPRIEETIEAMRRAVSSAGATMAQIDRVLLVGGSSRIPLVGQAVAAATGTRVMVDAHPKHAIALGAALIAAQARGPARDSMAPAVAPPADVGGQGPEPGRLAPAGSRRPSRRPSAGRLGLAGGAAAAVALGAAAAFALFGGSGDEDEGPVAAQPMASPTAPAASPAAATTVQATATIAATAATAVASPMPSASISRITVESGRYRVDFTVGSLELRGVNNVVHVHFFWDSVPVSAAGVPGTGPWYVYGGSSPFTGYTVAERPPGARQLCVLVANPDHSIRPGTGNCVALP